MSPCRCRKGKGLRATATTTTKNPGVTTDGGVKFALNAGGEVRTFNTELEARAAKVRAGGVGVIYPKRG